jgi:hypothetical protein
MPETIVNLPDADERAVLRAQKAIESYAKHVEQGQRAALAAIIEYGLALLEGRKLYPPNKDFKAWVTANGLDRTPPWNQREERHKAMQIAEISVVGTVPTTSPFDGCPYTRPTHIMSWYRKQQSKSAPGEARKRAPAIKLEKALQAIDDLKAEGKPVTRETVAERTGASVGTAQRAIIAYEAMAKSPSPDPVEGLSESAKTKLERAILAHKQRLSRDFEAMVYAEVRKRIETANDFVRKELKSAQAQLAGMSKMLGSRGVFTKLEYKQLLMCVHPDQSASKEVKEHIFSIVKRSELVLVKPEK